jgi:hypothetical protein
MTREYIIMPFIVKPIEEIKSVDIQPHIDKVENTQIDSLAGFYLLVLVLFFYLFRGFFFGLLVFLFKLSILGIFAFLTYSLFLA